MNFEQKIFLKKDNFVNFCPVEFFQLFFAQMSVFLFPNHCISLQNIPGPEEAPSILSGGSAVVVSVVSVSVVAEIILRFSKCEA